MRAQVRITPSRQPQRSASTAWPACKPALILLAALLALSACSVTPPLAGPPVADTSSPPPLPREPELPSSASPQPTQEASSPLTGCTSPATLTQPMTEGPYFKPGSPERQSLIEDKVTGTRLSLTGYVLTQDCQPVAGAMLDFWQADGSGVYDNTGYRLRGHQFTSRTGQYQLETVVPGEYPGRTPHIHVKVQAPTGPVLTTQVYFPNEPGNDTDAIFSPQLLVTVQKSNGSVEASFDFVVGGQ